LFRRATILSLEDSESNGKQIVVNDGNIDAAFQELTVSGGGLTRRLLGVS
jgi:hypothetical protein